MSIPLDRAGSAPAAITTVTARAPTTAGWGAADASHHERLALAAQARDTDAAASLISFEPRDAALVEARAALRAVLGGLNAKPAELLHGRAMSELPLEVDFPAKDLYRRHRAPLAAAARAQIPATPTSHAPTSSDTAG